MDKEAGGDKSERLVLYLVLAFIVYMLAQQVLKTGFLSNISFPSASPAPASSLGDIFVGPNGPTPLFQMLSSLYFTWIPIAVFFSLLFLAAIIYFVVRVYQIRQAEYSAYVATAHPIASGDVSRTQLRWERILERAHSDSEQDWRLSIIDADIMLDELLTVLGYHGETMAEKMKRVERRDFNTIDLAWEAHKVRNRLAHEGTEYQLNAREVRRIITLYEQVFREFKYIS